MTEKLEKLEEEVVNFKERPDVIINKIEVIHSFSLDLNQHSDFILAKEEEYEHDGYQGEFFNIPVFVRNVDVYNVDVIVEDNFCHKCQSEQLFDEILNEHYCPVCDEDSWLNKKRRKFFMLMDKL